MCIDTAMNKFYSTHVILRLVKGCLISHIPLIEQTSIPYKVANISRGNFSKYIIYLKVNKILNTISHIPGRKMHIIPYPLK